MTLFTRRPLTQREREHIDATRLQPPYDPGGDAYRRHYIGISEREQRERELAEQERARANEARVEAAAAREEVARREHARGVEIQRLFTEAKVAAKSWADRELSDALAAARNDRDHAIRNLNTEAAVAAEIRAIALERLQPHATAYAKNPAVPGLPAISAFGV